MQHSLAVISPITSSTLGLQVRVDLHDTFVSSSVAFTIDSGHNHNQYKDKINYRGQMCVKQSFIIIITGRRDVWHLLYRLRLIFTSRQRTNYCGGFARLATASTKKVTTHD